MLKQLRENTKTILWIVVVTFVVSIFAVWGMNFRSGGRPSQSENIVGTVDGEKIYRQSYNNTYQELLNSVRMQRGEDIRLSDSEAYMLGEQAWEMTIQKILIDKEIKRLGITVTDNELVSFLRRNPHPTLRQMFADDEGNFDYQAYLQALSNPNADWTELEKWGRSVIPEMKLETMLSSQVYVSENQIIERFQRETTRITAEYVKVAFVEEDPPYDPSESEISGFYKDNKDDLKTAEKRRIKLIKIEKAPTRLDEIDVYDRMMDLRGEILGGLDFAEAAKQESDDFNTAQKGGDLGYFGRGVMDSVFTEVAFSLEPGQISEPVMTNFGYHLIRVEDKKTEDGVEKVKASHILMRIDPGYDTIDSLRTLISDLRDTVKDRGLDGAAEEFGLDISEPEPFVRGSFIKGQGYLPRIVNFSFNHNVGTVSGAIESEKYVYIVEVTEIIPESFRPIEEVRTQIAERIRAKRREDAALARAEELRRTAITGGDLESAAHSMELGLAKTPPFTVDSSIPEIGSGTGFAVAAYDLKPGVISPPIKGNSEWFVVKVIDRVPGRPEELAAQRGTLLDQIRQEESQRFLALWYDKLRKDAKVKDWRENTLD